jgi:uncharacterized repeat protein (TIGR03803 family)
MRGKRLSDGLVATLVIFTVTLFVMGTCAAAERKLHNFGITGTDSAEPYYAGLIFDAAGNLYGTTVNGGSYGEGTVFELTPDGSGGWAEKKLHNFGITGADGTGPAAGLIFDSAGNLYGTTTTGGTYGQGTVFELTPNGSGGWVEKVLHNFGITGGTDGTAPFAGLIFDSAGSLYGTTVLGGRYNAGTVFELTPNGSGGWTEKKLHNFNNNGTDGYQPYGGLIFDATGNLYGTTYYGGDYPCGSRGCGTVFELTPEQGGGWTEKKLHNFGIDGTDGVNPSAGLIFDSAGSLYSTTYAGGDYGSGTVFELTPNGSGGWTEKKLHNFGIDGADGVNPYAGLIFDTAGNLYGTTNVGGDYSSGTVFELTPEQGGGWTEKKLHNFGIDSTDGVSPYAGLIFDTAGNLYGTTYFGGDYSSGTAFEVTP